MVLIQTRTNVLSVLIWVQTVCKDDQQMTKVAFSMERVNYVSHIHLPLMQQADMSGGRSNGAKQRHANTETGDQTSSKVTDGTPDSKCSYCNKSGNVKTCSGCKKTKYCSRVCQKADWKSHKHRCDAHKQVLFFSYLYIL